VKFFASLLRRLPNLSPVMWTLLHAAYAAAAKDGARAVAERPCVIACIA
jgi:hypothetical protein